MATDNVINFWSSLITNKKLDPYVENLMNIEDLEERGFSMLSRISFLWCMGVKFERDKLASLVQKIENFLVSKSNNSCGRCTDIELLIKKAANNCQEENDLDMTTETCSSPLKVSENTIMKRLPETPSPNNKVKKSRSNKENVQKSPKEPNFGKILAPETQHFLQEKMPELECEAFIIPETVQTVGFDEFCYGDADIFETEDSNKKGSPILGKQNKANHTPLSVECKRLTLAKNSPLQKREIHYPPKKLFGESHFSPVKALQDKLQSPESISNSPSLLDCQGLRSSKSLFKSDALNSPFNEKENSTVIQDTHPSVISKASVVMLDSSLSQSATPSSSKNQENLHNLRQSPRKKNLLSRSKSELGSSLSNKVGLSKLRNLTMKESKIGLELEIDISKPKKKNYRQTKITRNYFLKKTNAEKLTRGTDKKVSDKEDKALREAIEESIRSKEVEDVLRLKKQEIDQENATKIKKLRPRRGKDEGEASNHVEISPKRNSPSKKDGVTKYLLQEVSSTALAQDQSKDRESRVKLKSKLSKSRPRPAYQDSFDLLPEQEKEPQFVYKSDAVRKKSERKRLDGWDCHECRDYYNSKGITDVERKVMQNKCSRHRSKHREYPNTPEGFWVVGWGDDTCENSEK